jgi:hypothetical protein
MEQEPFGPAWYRDPTWRHEVRYWSGTEWTDRVADEGVQTVDPVTIRPVFLFGREGSWMSVEEEATPIFPDLVVEEDFWRGECTAFDVDGQLLDVVVVDGDQDEYAALPTGRYDQPRLIGLARRHAESLGYELTSEDPLLELANRDLLETYARDHRPHPRLLRWFFVPPADPIPGPMPYTR